MKGRHLNRLMEMAQESGRDPQEVYEELLDQATSTDAPPTPSPANAAAPQSPRHDGSRVAKVTVAPRPPAPPLGESIASKKSRESDGEDDDDQNAASASDAETDDAPPEQMKGSKPNPLRSASVKDWAGRKDDSIPDASPEPKQDERSRLRMKYLAHRGRAQR